MSLQDFDEMPRFIQVIHRSGGYYLVQYYNYSEDGDHTKWGFSFTDKDLKKALKEAYKFRPQGGRVLYTELRLM